MQKASTNYLWQKRFKPLLTVVIILLSVCLLFACAGDESGATVDIDEPGSGILIRAVVFALGTMTALTLIFFLARIIIIKISRLKKVAGSSKIESTSKSVPKNSQNTETGSPTMATKTAPTSFEFSGKLDLFIIKKSARKPFPTTYKLNVNQTITLQELLEKCAMMVSIYGAQYIFFSFEHGVLHVVNNSARSFLVGNAELAENQAHQLVNGEAVVFSCEEGDNLVVSPRFLYQSRKRSSR
jgi:hypothetical protein